MWIPDYLIEKLKIKSIVYNNKINNDELKKIYDSDYNIIKKKIEKINIYLRDINIL